MENVSGTLKILRGIQGTGVFTHLTCNLFYDSIHRIYLSCHYTFIMIVTNCVKKKKKLLNQQLIDKLIINIPNLVYFVCLLLFFFCRYRFRGGSAIQHEFGGRDDAGAAERAASSGVRGFAKPT